MLLLLALSCTPEPIDTDVEVVVQWEEPDGLGGWEVGTRTEVVPDPRGGELTLQIWYPAEPGGGLAEYDLPYVLQTVALAGPPAIGGPHPLVMFSHGHGGSRLQSIFLTEHLASHGFVVVAMDHPGDTLFDFDADLAPVVAGRRPGDVRVATDWAVDASAEPGHWLEGRVRPSEIGMLGHSFGAWTTLVVAGGLLDVAAGAAWCEEHDPAGCGIVGGIVLPESGVPEPDPRVTVAMGMAVGGGYSFSDLSAVGPVLLVGGTRDGDLPYAEEQRPTYERLGTPRTLMTLDRAGHFGFTDACALLPLGDCAGEDDDYMEPLRVQALSKSAVTAFAGVHLLHDDRFAPWLSAEAWPADEATWESVLTRR